MAAGQSRNKIKRPINQVDISLWNLILNTYDPAFLPTRTAVLQYIQISYKLNNNLVFIRDIGRENATEIYTFACYDRANSNLFQIRYVQPKRKHWLYSRCGRFPSIRHINAFRRTDLDWITRYVTHIHIGTSLITRRCVHLQIIRAAISFISSGISDLTLEFPTDEMMTQLISDEKCSNF